MVGVEIIFFYLYSKVGWSNLFILREINKVEIWHLFVLIFLALAHFDSLIFLACSDSVLTIMEASFWGFILG